MYIKLKAVSLHDINNNNVACDPISRTLPFDPVSIVRVDLLLTPYIAFERFALQTHFSDTFPTRIHSHTYSHIICSVIHKQIIIHGPRTFTV